MIGAFLIGVVLAVAGQPVFSFTDPAITESSGLVDLGDLMVTVNDSGNDPILFVVDPATGDTVGRTWFAASTRDVEAVAPAGDDQVWVGDLGDNTATRPSVEVFRVPVRRGERRVDAPAYQLVYPDGPHDAESLFVGPEGRLHIVAKSMSGATVYRAPAALSADEPNQLTRVLPGKRLAAWATDAAIFPDGRHVLVRGYGSASVYTFPDFGLVGSFELPEQQQGEAVSIGPGDRIRIGSEGLQSTVLQVELPAELAAAMLAPDAPVTPPVTEPPGWSPPDESIHLPWAWVAAGGVLLAAAIGGAAAVVRRRRGA